MLPEPGTVKRLIDNPLIIIPLRLLYTHNTVLRVGLIDRVLAFCFRGISLPVRSCSCTCIYKCNGQLHTSSLPKAVGLGNISLSVSLSRCNLVQPHTVSL